MKRITLEEEAPARAVPLFSEEQIIELYKQMPLTKLCVVAKISSSTLYSILEKHNVSTKYDKVRERREKVLKLYDDGLTVKEIAKKLNSKYYNISATIYRYGDPHQQRDKKKEVKILAKKVRKMHKKYTLPEISKKLNLPMHRVRYLKYYA